MRHIFSLLVVVLPHLRPALSLVRTTSCYTPALHRRDQYDASNSFFQIFTSLKIPCDGTLLDYRFIARTTGTVYFTVWRPIYTNHGTDRILSQLKPILLHKVRVNETGWQTHIVPPPSVINGVLATQGVLKDDVLGIHYEVYRLKEKDVIIPAAEIIDKRTILEYSDLIALPFSHGDIWPIIQDLWGNNRNFSLKAYNAAHVKSRRLPALQVRILQDEIKTCGDAPPNVIGVMSRTDFVELSTPGDRINYYCAPGYVRQSGNVIVYCGSDYEWVGARLRCVVATVDLQTTRQPTTPSCPDALPRCDNYDRYEVQPSCLCRCSYGQSGNHTSCTPPSGFLTKLIMPTCAEQADILAVHNRIRGEGCNPCGTQKVSFPPAQMEKLRWNEELAQSAGCLAAQCRFGHDSTAQRKTGVWSWVGQNLFALSGRIPSWREAIAAWAKEKEKFNYGLGPTTALESVGHYTQIVWSNTTAVGCGMAKCSGHDQWYEYVLVCNYGPGGNVRQSHWTSFYDCPYSTSIGSHHCTKT